MQSEVEETVQEGQGYVEWLGVVVNLIRLSPNPSAPPPDLLCVWWKTVSPLRFSAYLARLPSLSLYLSLPSRVRTKIDEALRTGLLRGARPEGRKHQQHRQATPPSGRGDTANSKHDGANLPTSLSRERARITGPPAPTPIPRTADTTRARNYTI